MEGPEIKGVDWIELDGVQQSSLEVRKEEQAGWITMMNNNNSNNIGREKSETRGELWG